MPKKLKVSFAIVVLCLFAAGVVFMLGKSRIGSKLDAIKAQGHPTGLSEIDDFYSVPSDALDSTREWVAVIDMLTMEEVQRRSKDIPIGGCGDQPPPPGTEWAPLDESREFLVSLSTELAATRDAAGKGGYVRFPVDFSMGINALLPHTQGIRQVARLLVLDAHVAAHEGDFLRVHNDISAVLTASETLHYEPCLISQLVRYALRGIAIDLLEKLLPHADWSDAQLAMLQSKLLSSDIRSGLRRSLVGERAMSMGAIDQLGLSLFRTSNEVEVLNFYEETIEGLDGGWTSSIRTGKKLSEKLRKLASSPMQRAKYSAAIGLMPAIEQVSVAGARAVGLSRCAATVLAIRRYELRNGKEIESVDELTEDLFALPEGYSMQQVRTDPFDDQPMKSMGESDYIGIYSVGKDLKDDRGDLGTDGQAGTDVGVRLFRANTAEKPDAGGRSESEELRN